jgi:hypothetical protein
MQLLGGLKQSHSFFHANTARLSKFRSLKREKLGARKCRPTSLIKREPQDRRSNIIWRELPSPPPPPYIVLVIDPCAIFQEQVQNI